LRAILGRGCSSEASLARAESSLISFPPALHCMLHKAGGDDVQIAGSCRELPVDQWSSRPVVAADEWQQLLPILELVGNKQYPEAIASYEKYLQQAQRLCGAPWNLKLPPCTPRWEYRAGAVMLEQAIQSGFDDCISIQQDADLKPIRNHPVSRSFIHASAFQRRI